MKTPVAVAVALASLVLAGPANAHFVLRFDPQTARPGDTVSVGFADAHDVTVEVYLVPLEAARRFEPPPLRAPVELVPLGTLGPAPRGAAFLLVFLGAVILAALLAAAVIVHRRWQDAVSG